MSQVIHMHVTFPETFAKQIINFKLNDQDYNIMLALYNLIYQENLDKHDYSSQITSNTIDSILLLLAIGVYLNLI